MSDATYFLLDALLGAAHGMLVSQRAKTIQEEYNMPQDPRSGFSRVLTNPVTSAGTSLISAYLFNRDMVANAKNYSGQRRVAGAF